jgi:hypothetical protein
MFFCVLSTSLSIKHISLMCVCVYIYIYIYAHKLSKTLCTSYADIPLQKPHVVHMHVHIYSHKSSPRHRGRIVLICLSRNHTAIHGLPNCRNAAIIITPAPMQRKLGNSIRLTHVLSNKTNTERA